MNNGIALYFGLEESLEENLQYVKKAATMGINRYFTSLQIPGTDQQRLQEEFAHFMVWNKVQGGEIICDISPYTFQILKLSKGDYKALSKLGLNSLRLDDGFSAEEMAEMVKAGFKVVLNASTCNRALLSKLQDLKVDFSKVEAMHNFYPKRFTGLNREYFLSINKLFKEYGIKVNVFVPDYTKPRMPLYQGLSTMEEHRYLPFILAYQDCISMGVDNIFIGDCLAGDEVLQQLAKEEETSLSIPWAIKSQYNFLTKDLFNREFTLRPEVTDYTYRLVESRKVFAQYSIPSDGDCYAHRGDVLINNDLAGRYKGEVEIAKGDFHCGATYNLLGNCHPLSLKLLASQYFHNKIKFLDLTIVD